MSLSSYQVFFGYVEFFRYYHHHVCLQIYFFYLNLLLSVFFIPNELEEPIVDLLHIYFILRGHLSKAELNQFLLFPLVLSDETLLVLHELLVLSLCVVILDS